MAFKMRKTPYTRKVKDFSSPIDMRSPVKNDEKDRLDETYMTDTERRLLEIKRQRALLNKEKEFKEKKKEQEYRKLTDKELKGQVKGGSIPFGFGDFYKIADKVIRLDFDQEPVNKQ
tara:strand:+ start:196 stop:546 length:351 start_codon:yes stop_codon:yes gene_type:complete